MLHFMQVNSINAALGAKVADFRKAHGWSQAQLAERFGSELGRPMDATTITRLEQGKRPVPVHELIALSRVLTVEPTVFFKFLGPLDDAVAALRFAAQGLDAKRRVAEIEAEAAAGQLSALESLQEFRDTKDVADLVAGLSFFHTIPQFDRSDWRELLLDADVPTASITAATKAVPGMPGEPFGEVRQRFIEALISDVVNPPKRRRKAVD